MRIRDHLQWQDDTNLDAFITRLTDSEERVRQNVRQYVVGETVRDRLDSMFKAVGERAYTALSHHAVDSLIQAMSSFAPEAGDMGLINRLDSQANSLVQSAWGDVIQGRAHVA